MMRVCILRDFCVFCLPLLSRYLRISEVEFSKMRVVEYVEFVRKAICESLIGYPEGIPKRDQIIKTSNNLKEFKISYKPREEKKTNFIINVQLRYICLFIYIYICFIYLFLRKRNKLIINV